MWHISANFAFICGSNTDKRLDTELRNLEKINWRRRGCISTKWNSIENGGAHTGERVGDIWVKRVFTASLLIINGYRVIIRINTGHPKLGTNFGPQIRALARYYPRLRLGQ